MDSLKNIVKNYLIFSFIRKEINIVCLKKLPDELFEYIFDEINKEIITSKKDSVIWEETVMNMCVGVTTKNDRLKLVEKSHNYGFCKELYNGCCHLCNDHFCVVCSPRNYNSDGEQCINCFIRTTKEEIKKIKIQSENYNDIIGPLKFYVETHEQGICECSLGRIVHY